MKNRIPASLDDLQTIPGVGRSVVQDLRDLGITSAAMLKGKNPEKLYLQLCSLRGQHIDRCMLYTFRCAVYFVTEKKHDPQKLKWWYWKETA